MERCLTRGEEMFPLVLTGSGMSRATHFENDRRAIQELRNRSREALGFGYAIYWKQQESRRFKTQSIPASISIPTRDDYTLLLSKCDEVRAFEKSYTLISGAFPELVTWVHKYPLRVVEYASVWSELIAVCHYLRHNGPTQCYIRELPVPVDTKFIERHKAILAELLPIVAPACVGDDETTFESRFGFRQKQLLLRFRAVIGPAVQNNQRSKLTSGNTGRPLPKEKGRLASCGGKPA